MATDETPPYNKIIALTALGTVLVLVGLKFVFDSYFTMMSEEAAFEKLAPTTALDKQHVDERAKLTTSPIPITVAMKDVSRSRLGNALIEPRASEDLGPMKGWSEMERAFETPPAKAAIGGQPLPNGATAPGDAGAAPNAPNANGDAGAMPNAAPGDAGANMNIHAPRLNLNRRHP